MSYQFPDPPFVDGYVCRFTKWGEGVIGRTKKFELKRTRRIAVSTVGGNNYVHEPPDQAIARIAREDAAARDSVA